MTSGLFECGLRLHGLPYRRGLETNFVKFLNFGWRLKWLFMNTFYKILVVWVFGGLGAVTRYGVLLFMDARGLGTGNWLGLPTLVFNVTACFIIGFLAGLIYTHAEWSDTLKGALSLSAMTGFCGGFSSFSPLPPIWRRSRSATRTAKMVIPARDRSKSGPSLPTPISRRLPSSKMIACAVLLKK